MLTSECVGIERMKTKTGFYLTVGLTGVVMRDIVGLMKEAMPGLVQISADTLSEAASRIGGAQPLPVAFMHLPPDEFVASELWPLLDALRTRAVLMGSAAEEAAEDSRFSVLMRPFGEDDLLKIVKPYFAS